jgi:hypothetical protein
MLWRVNIIARIQKVGVFSARLKVKLTSGNFSAGRLREVSATYYLPDRWARYFSASQISFTAAGRNLGILTGYSGIDPRAGTGDSIGVQSD